MNPAELRNAIAKDLKPARPLLPPSTRALLLAPLALATVVAVPSFYLFRPDLAELGVIAAWGLSFVEAAVGLAIVGLALRESIPGRALSGGAVCLTVAVGLGLPLLVYVVTAQRFDIGVPPRAQLYVAYLCFRTSLGAAVPALMATTVLVARAYPLRPGVTGVLYGLGCGVIADAGLRLYCEFTMPSHVLTAHGGAIVAAMAIGPALARFTRSNGAIPPP